MQVKKAIRQHVILAALIATISLCAGGLTAVAAAASEVVMPYRCDASGGRVRLIPSEPRHYDIIGRREQDMVTACAPNDERRCRTWRIHRFEMNCNGARVPWIDIVDAANAMNAGPATVRNGRLYVRMDPWWARRSRGWDGPKLREFGPGDFRPKDFDYRPSERAPSVEMPAGFAPVIGIRAQLIDTPPRPGETQSPPSAGAMAANGSDGQWSYGKAADPRTTGAIPSPVPAPQKSEPQPQAVEAPPPKTSAVPAPAPKTSTSERSHTFGPKDVDEKQPDTKSGTANASPPTAEPPPAERTAALADAPAPAALPPANPAGQAADATINSVAPTILNHPGGETTSVTAATSSSGDKAGTEVAAAAPDVAIPATLEPSASLPPLFTPSSVPNSQIVFGIAALAMLGAAAAFVTRRRNETAYKSATAARDLSAVSLDAHRLPAVAPRAEPALTVPKPPAQQQSPAHTFQPPPPMRSSLTQSLLTKAPPSETFVTGPIVEPEWLPVTRDEALQVLGAGPDASDAVLKKIVDGLRMSWHPDHSKSADDHRLRSERMTQINVAWDILTGRQAAEPARA